jgi:hypothetical protein
MRAGCGNNRCFERATMTTTSTNISSGYGSVITIQALTLTATRIVLPGITR